jgi:hypothetical protein
VALKHGKSEIFTPRWVAGLAPVAESAMAATVEVYTPTTDRVYDVDTDTWVLGPNTVHYYGKARVQPIRSARIEQNTGDPTTIQGVRVQIPISEQAYIRPDQRMRVVSARLNPLLLGYQFIVTEMVDSSNPFEQTFECTVNNETVVA